MKVLFMLERRVNAGSIHAVASYVKTGNRLGHTFALFGRSDPAFPDIRFSTDVRGFDYVLFIIESGLEWLNGVRAPRILAEIPRRRRVVLDADGMYNPIIRVDDYDRNHASEQERSQWLATVEALSDRILQPTFEPRVPGVVAFPFYGYDRGKWPKENKVAKRYDILHVGHNWWRWREVSTRILPALEAIRDRVGPIAFVGCWWDEPPAWFRSLELEAAFAVDPERFARLRIETRPAVSYTEVVPTMSTGRLNVMTQRPLFRTLRLFTSKYFEIFAAKTIPLVMLDPDHAGTVYGSAGRELALYERIGDKLLDALADPEKYHSLVEEVREHLEAHHTYRHRVGRLVAILGGWEGSA